MTPLVALSFSSLVPVAMFGLFALGAWLVLEALGSAERDTPDYITVDAKAMSATFVRAPELAEVPYPVKMEPNLVVEFYAS